MLSVVKGVEPGDQVEAMLAAQMAAVHMATMTFARRLAHVENIAQQDSAERAFIKLARTFAAQVEALKRYRSRGDQTVRVEHVTVNDGSRAIVGNVTQGGGVRWKTRRRPHEPEVFFSGGSTLLGQRQSAPANGARPPQSAVGRFADSIAREGAGPRGKRNGMFQAWPLYERSHD